MKLSRRNRGFKLIEVVFTTVLVGVLGLLIYSLLNINTILGAKNTAVNTAHQQARVAMLQMVGDLHSSISLPQLTGVSGNTASGISFQEWAINSSGQASGGPWKIISDAAVGDDNIRIWVPSNQMRPIVGQRLIIPTHQIEADITSVSGPNDNVKVNLASIYGPALTPPVNYPVNLMPIVIKGTGSSAGDVVCFITDRCSYAVANLAGGGLGLNWTRQGTRTMVNDITSSAPFSTPSTPAGALYYRFVAAIDLSTADQNYNNRGFKSANVLLNGQVPLKARLTTYQ
jgi:type II secretory pathway pseudopilin PulG